MSSRYTSFMMSCGSELDHRPRNQRPRGVVPTEGTNALPPTPAPLPPPPPDPELGPALEPVEPEATGEAGTLFVALFVRLMRFVTAEGLVRLWFLMSFRQMASVSGEFTNQSVRNKLQSERGGKRRRSTHSL